MDTSTDDGGWGKEYPLISKFHSDRLEAMAVTRGWIKDRFPTRATREEIEQVAKERGGPTIIEMAALTTFDLMQSENLRARGIGAASAVAMEKANQADDLKEQPELHLHAHADAEAVRTEVLERLRRARGVLPGPVAGPSDNGNGHPGGLGGDNGAGPLGNGTAPSADQHGSNGSHHGNGTAGPDR